MGHIRKSHWNRSTDSYDETSPENCTPESQNTESHAASTQECRRAHPRIPYRIRGRITDQGLPKQSLATSRSDHDPAGLPAWAARVRTVQSAMDTSRLRSRKPRSHSSEKRSTGNSPADRSRTTGAAQAAPGG